MKKISALILVVLFLLTIQACAKDPDSLTLQINASTNDCYAIEGYLVVNDAYIIVGNNLGYPANGGMRFTGFPFKPVVDSAFFYLRSPINNTYQPNIKIYCEDVDSSLAFTDYEDFENRTKTTQYISWTSWEDWENQGWYKSPNLASIMNPVIFRTNWKKVLTFLIYDNGSDTNEHRSWCQYDWLDPNREHTGSPILKLYFSSWLEEEE